MTVITFLFLLSTEITAQEKVDYLQHKYDGYTEIIHKKFTKKQLQDIKYKFARQGVVFIFSGLKLNKNNEITEINIMINNKKSKASIKWNNSNKPIPKIKFGEINGIVTITLNPQAKN